MPLSRLVVAAGVSALLLQLPAAEAAPSARQTFKNYTTPSGVTNVYPQQFFEMDSEGEGPTDKESIGGWTGGARKTENRFMVKAEDITGRPVAISLYWYDGIDEKVNQVKVVCGGTTQPLPIKPGTGVHALMTAGDGCPGQVSTPTRGKITFTWTYEKPLKRKR